MIPKSKKSLAAEKDVADLQGRLAKARSTLETAFETDADGTRIPELAATVSIIERRMAAAEKLLHVSRIADAVEAVKAAQSAHSACLKTYHAGKAKHEAEVLALYSRKKGLARQIARDRKLSPDWLVDLRKARHVSFQKVMEAFEDLRVVDPVEAARRGYQRLGDYTLPPPPAKEQVG